jgi:hypothetical protein
MRRYPLSTHPEVPLVIHARYTRVEILAAFGIGITARVCCSPDGAATNALSTFSDWRAM